ncbi:MAG TPA: hypothetical protein K8W19_17900 [Victivallis vadensis]|nr:hypothetical protein [Victivallis vadensis]
MKKRITAILAFCGIFALGASAGWEQERDDAARLRSEAERSLRTPPTASAAKPFRRRRSWQSTSINSTTRLRNC